MPQIALVVLGLFVLVWIISAVVKASQDVGPRPRPGAPRPRPVNDGPRVERTSDTDIDRFMAEIDRLRRRGEGAPAGRAPVPARGPGSLADRPTTVRPEPRPRPGERRDRDRERRVRQSQRQAPPPPLPSDPVPVLRPVAPDPSAAPASGTPSTPSRPSRPAKAAATTVNTGVSGVPASPVLAALQSLLQSRQGPAAALILAEIFKDPPGKRALMRQAPPPQAG